MADQDNPGQFGNREDTIEEAIKGGEASTGGGGNHRGGNNRGTKAHGAAGKTEAAKRGGEHSHSGRKSR